MNKEKYYAMEAVDVMLSLSTGAEGLSESEVALRLQKYGRNILPSKKSIPAVIIFLHQFASPLLILLIVAALISAYLNDYKDVTVIAITVAITAIFGFVQEIKAERSLAALHKVIEKTARVRRFGRETVVNAEDLTIGDVVILENGDKIAADLRILEAKELSADEATLTGESLPQKKTNKAAAINAPLAERLSMLYAGTVVVGGEGCGVVVAVGTNTELGRIASGLRSIKDEPAKLALQIRRLAFAITLIVVSAALMIIAIGFLRGYNPADMLITAVAVSVAAIPEGMVVSVTVILVIGMMHLLKNKALVRRLSSAESLGGVSVICLDKTGTLTEGKMSAREFVGDKTLLSELTILGVSARVVNLNDSSDLWKISGEGTEVALLAGAFLNVNRRLYSERVILNDAPFSSNRGYRATISVYNGKKTLTVIGMPEKILHASRGDFKNAIFSEKDLVGWRNEIKRMGDDGMRIVAIGYRRLEEDCDLSDSSVVLSKLTFAGVVGLGDPLRDNAAKTVRLLHNAGIRTIMITGDGPATALAVARQAGITENERVFVWSEAQKLSAGALETELLEYSVFSRVPPTEKLTIVKALQSNGQTVAMTGDGVNDAPALKQANIGVVVGSGTDVAKEVADLVILDNNLETIVKAVAGGRRIFENIRKVALFLLIDSFQEVSLISAALIFGWPLPLLPAQILWVNLIEDTFPAFSLAFESEESRVMNEPPRRSDETILGGRYRRFLLIYGAVCGIVLILFFIALSAFYVETEKIRTMVFLALGADSLFVIFSLRRIRTGVLKTNPFYNRYLVISVFGGWLLYALGIYWTPLAAILGTVALGWYDWLIVMLYAILQLALADSLKNKFLSSNVGKVK
jgi:Ca2+-transporting ATPase